MTAQFDHYEIHSYTTSYPINEDDLKNIGLDANLEDINDLIRPFIGTVKPVSKFEEFKELIVREVISYGARSITDRGPNYTGKQAELRDLREKVKLPKEPTKEDILSVRLVIAQSVWITYALRDAILRKFKHTNDDVNHMIYSEEIATIPQLFLINPVLVSDAIRITITEEISKIEKNGNRNFFTKKVTRKGPRSRKARKILELRIKKIFEDLAVDSAWTDDLIDGLLLVLGIKKDFD
jgi:hypothetical protein